MKSLAERHAQRNEIREDAGLDPVDYGTQAGARSAKPSKKAAKTADVENPAGGNGGGAAADPWKPGN